MTPDPFFVLTFFFFRCISNFHGHLMAKFRFTIGEGMSEVGPSFTRSNQVL
jgi:hypothetical protein